MQFRVEPTGVAHRLPLCVSAPQGGCAGLAVGAGEADPSGGGLDTENKQIMTLYGGGDNF